MEEMWFSKMAAASAAGWQTDFRETKKLPNRQMRWQGREEVEWSIFR